MSQVIEQLIKSYIKFPVIYEKIIYTSALDISSDLFVSNDFPAFIKGVIQRPFIQKGELLGHLCVCVCVTQSCLSLSDAWTIARQAPLSVGFSRQEHWSGFLFPSPDISYMWNLKEIIRSEFTCKRESDSQT